VLREVTERPEGVEAGVVELVGTSPPRILAAAARHLGAAPAWTSSERPPNPYGDGHAAERIVDIVAHTLLGTPRRTTDWTGPGPTESAAEPLAPDLLSH
jgi:UDP-N-acetylglucosamine 2-epimerase (non-hydrolysing)